MENANLNFYWRINYIFVQCVWEVITVYTKARKSVQMLVLDCRSEIKYKENWLPKIFGGDIEIFHLISQVNATFVLTHCLEGKTGLFVSLWRALYSRSTDIMLRIFVFLILKFKNQSITCDGSVFINTKDNLIH